MQPATDINEYIWVKKKKISNQKHESYKWEKDRYKIAHGMAPTQSIQRDRVAEFGPAARAQGVATALQPPPQKPSEKSAGIKFKLPQTPPHKKGSLKGVTACLAFLKLPYAALIDVF